LQIAAAGHRRQPTRQARNRRPRPRGPDRRSDGSACWRSGICANTPAWDREMPASANDARKPRQGFVQSFAGRGVGRRQLDLRFVANHRHAHFHRPEVGRRHGNLRALHLVADHEGDVLVQTLGEQRRLVDGQAARVWRRRLCAGADASSRTRAACAPAERVERGWPSVLSPRAGVVPAVDGARDPPASWSPAAPAFSARTCASACSRAARRAVRRQLLHRAKTTSRTCSTTLCFELMRHDVTFPLYVEVDASTTWPARRRPIHYQFDPVQTTKTSVHGAINMLGLAKRVKARILQASTSEVYGDPRCTRRPRTTGATSTRSACAACYDEGKRCAETLFFDYHRQHGCDIKVVRIFNTYGPRMHPDDGRVVSNFIVQALRGEGHHDLRRRLADAQLLLCRRPDRGAAAHDGHGPTKNEESLTPYRRVPPAGHQSHAAAALRGRILRCACSGREYPPTRWRAAPRASRRRGRPRTRARSA
jgi:hypothetical protein